MIYLLEDDENIRKLVLYTFNSQGMEAMGFMKPSEFWKQMKKQLPDVILLVIFDPVPLISILEIYVEELIPDIEYNLEDVVSV